MGVLDQVTEGKIVEPIFALVYGVPGIGKSTFASEGEKPLFLGDAKESSHLNVARLPEPKTYHELLDQIEELIEAKTLKYKTIAIDNLGWIESLIFAEVCKEHNKKDIVAVGYGNGYKAAVEKHFLLVLALSELRKQKKVDIVIIGHSKVKTFQDPTTTSGYDRYQLSINEEAANVWYRSVDAVLFLNYEVLKIDDNDKRAQGSGVRMMYTQERPQFQAKNRYGLPYRLVLAQGEGWSTFKKAIKAGEPESVDTLIEEIEGLKANVKDEALLKKIGESVVGAGKDAVKLTAIKDRLISVIGGIK